MKTTVIFAFLSFVVLLTSNPATAQTERGELSPEQRERIEAMRVAFITREIQLTSKQAEVFWPVYREMKAELDELREDSDLIGKNPMEMDDAEAGKHLDQWFERRQRELHLRESYRERLQNVISPKQILALYQAENQFRRQMLRQVRQGERMQRGRGDGSEINRRERIREHRDEGDYRRRN
ncbi:MAG: hypothetical protein EA409_07655 [Saprospirales bacterium]|nr:MAG: hypothetical protein EA409_07655 [Saprospirales bacterium]